MLTRARVKALFELNRHENVAPKLQLHFGDTCFKGITKLGHNFLNRTLVEWLVQNYDVHTSVMKVHNMSFSITEDEVNKAFGLHSGGTDIILQKSDTSGINKYGHLFTFNGQGKIKMSQLEIRLTEGLLEGDDFKVSYLVYVFGTFLFCGTTVELPNVYLNPLVDIENLETKNWAKLVLDSLNDAVSFYQANNGYMKGCPFLLEVQTNFFDTCQ